MNQLPDSPAAGAPAAGILAWLSIGFGVASWVLASLIPVGLDIAGILLGLLALRLAPRAAKGIRRAGWAGLVISGAKLLVMIGLLLWVFAAFMVNPVAH